MADLGLVAVSKQKWFTHSIGYKFLIKHAHDINFRKACSQILREMPVENILDSEEMKLAVIDNLLVDWSDIQENGVDVKYTPEKAREILVDEKYYMLYDFINVQSMKLADFIDEQIAETEKN